MSYNLEPSEYLVLKSEGILHGGLMAAYTDELILTNQNVVLVSKGILGNTKGIQIYPISQIKVFNGQAQAKLGKQRNGSPQLEIYFINGHEVFGFQQKRDALKWIESISQLLTGKSAEIDKGNRFAIPGTELVAETLKGTIDTFKGALGIQSGKPEKAGQQKRVSKKCVSCMAPISGYKGQITRCHYCDFDQDM